MKVLYVNHSCVLRVNQQRVAELARFEDVDVAMVAPTVWRAKDTGKTHFFEKPGDIGCAVHPMPAYLNFHPALYFYDPMALRRLVTRFRPDIIHFEPEPYSLGAYQMARLAQGYKAKLVVTAYQNIDKHFPWPLRMTERYTLQVADKVIGGTEETSEVWRKRSGGKDVVTIPMGYDPDLFCPRDAKWLRGQLRLRGFVIGYLGRLVEEKGLGTLLDAVGRLKGEFTLLIGGRGPYRSRILGKADALGGQRELRLIDPSHHEVPQYLNCMDALVVPSRSTPHWKEQFGRVLVEAMACGVPVIGSTCGSIPWVVGDAGLLFPERDSHALADRLARLMRDGELREELRARGLQRARTVFTWASVAAQMRQVYAEVLGNAPELGT